MRRYKLDPNRPRKGRTDWGALKGKTDEEVEAAAYADRDAQPLDDAALGRLLRVPDVKAIRGRLGLTQRQFANAFRLAIGTVRDWEQGRTVPEGPARILLTVIDREPKMVMATLRGEWVSRESKYLLELQEHADETISFLSNEGRIERERSVCRAFLRCLGVEFEERELKEGEREPVDVSFRDTRFQVTEIHETGRKRSREWKDRQERLSGANSLDDVLEDWAPPKPMDYSELIDLASAQLTQSKAHKYPEAEKANLDILIYVCLSGRILDVRSKIPDSNILLNQGWRSVSALFPPFGVVLAANEQSPQYLQHALGKARNSWSMWDTLFDPVRETE